jgi:hypothetical protein
MTNVLHWLASHWENWTLSSAFGFLGGLLAGAFKWLYPSRKDLREQRKTKKEEAIDLKILEGMRSGTELVVKNGQGAPGHQLFQAEFIARNLKIDLDEVVDSLGRLEAKGRVETIGSRIAGGAAPHWRLKPR